MTKKPPSFGQTLRALAQERGLSDAEVARKLGISGQRYGHYVRERNEPDRATLRAICAVLQTSPSVLFGFDDDGQRIRAGDLDPVRLANAIAGAARAFNTKLSDEEASRLADLAAVIYGRL